MLLIGALLVLTILPGAAPTLAGVQEAPTAGEGSITYERIDVPGTDRDFGDKLELYRFTFDPEASLPESEPFRREQDESPTISSEAMMVFVDSGPFVLYTPPTMEEGAVVVVSGDGTVSTERWLDRMTPAPEGPRPCASPCAVARDQYALLDPGDYVFQRANSGCVY